MTVFVASFLFVVLAEMGDKTQLLAMAFASIALFSTPARRAINLVRTGYRAWVKSRQQAAAAGRSGCGGRAGR